MKKKWTLILIPIALVVVLLVVKRNGHTSVETYTVTGGEVVNSITASGITAAKSDLVVRAPATSLIDKVNFKSGEQVSAGDIVIELNASELAVSVEDAWATYLTAKAAYDSIDDQIKAAEQSVEDKKFIRDVAREDYEDDDDDTNKQAYKTAQANYESAQSTLQVLKDKKAAILQTQDAAYASYLETKDTLDKGYIVAPASGYIALEDIYTGSYVTKGTKLFEVTNVSGLEFQAEIDESDIGAVREGLPVEVTLDGYTSDPISGFISRVDAKTTVTDDGSTVIHAIVPLDLRDLKPIVGMNGTASIEAQAQKGEAIVPLDAITYDEFNKMYVFIVSGDKVSRSEIIISFEGDDYVVVTSGVSAGDEIVVGDKVLELTDGAKISVIKDQ